MNNNNNKFIINKNREKTKEIKLNLNKSKSKKSKNNKLNKKTKQLTTKNLNKTNKNNHSKKDKTKLKKLKSLKIISYNDLEMNSLEYEEAKLKDKRSFCQYYTSLLRTKHILIFSFCLRKDYNSGIIKIYIFFLTFAINYLISAMFYSDSTMHKIYIDQGSFDFTYQLPQMFYSFIISTLLQNLLNLLGLYEETIIEFKKEKNKKLIHKTIFNIKCKMILFFISTYLMIFCFWIYLGCFCAVYKNTQIHLLLDVLSSFGISFITPFFICLLPGVFRVSALKSKDERSCMFKFSKLFQALL